MTTSRGGKSHPERLRADTRDTLQRLKQTTEDSSDGINITALVIGSAVGAVVGEFAKRQVFED